MPSHTRCSISAVISLKVAFTRQTFCRLLPRRDPGTRVHTIPKPFATSVPAAYSTTWVTSSVTSAATPPCACTPSPALSAFVFAFFFAATAASLSLEIQQDEAARGAKRERPNLIGVLEATVPQPARSPPAHKLSCGLETPSKVRRHGQHPGIIHPQSTATRHITPETDEPAGQHCPRRPPWNRSRRRPGARAAHLSPATPARDHSQPPPSQVSREPHAAKPQELSWNWCIPARSGSCTRTAPTSSWSPPTGSASTTWCCPRRYPARAGC